MGSKCTVQLPIYRYYQHLSSSAPYGGFIISLRAITMNACKVQESAIESQSSNSHYIHLLMGSKDTAMAAKRETSESAID